MRLTIALLLITLCSISFSQEKYGFDKSDSLYIIRTPGLGYWGPSECEKEIQKKYHFKTIPIGCLYYKKDKKNNTKVNRRLRRLNGKDWRIRYEKELAICRKNQTK